ncbi:MAG: peptide ABC transporter substrate-binding protein [Tissierellia bacterium]|nr:peptide ABC transporter substrate-binding protein [Tissierellia bacterium]
MKRKQIIALIMVLLLSLGALAGCANNNDAKTPNGETPSTGNETNGEKVEQVFRFSEGSAVLGLNPMINTTGPDNGLHHIILETLVADVVDEEGKSHLKPAAAEDWTISEDGLVYTFNIRENAVWNDGVPVTANDFVYTFQMMATPEVASTNAWLFDGIIKNFEEAHYNDGTGSVKPEDIGVKAIDEKTLEVTLAKPAAYFLDLLEGAKPVRQDKYEEWGEEYGSSKDKVVTNGPFVIESWDQNVQMTLVKNEKYWDAANVKLDKIERKTIQDQATAAQALLSGEIDVVSTKDPDWQNMIKAEGKFSTLVTQNSAPEFFGFNAANKYFKNPKIRIAFSLGFDREKFVNDLFDGISSPLYSMMPSNINVGDELYGTRVNGENEIIKALQEQYPDPKALLIEGLTEAGFDPDPAKMQVSLSTRGTSELSKKIAEWMLQEWQTNLGVKVTIDMIEWNVMWDKVDAGEYDIATSGWGPYYNDPNGLLSIYHPESGYFDATKSGWTGQDADRFAEILDEADKLTDNEERAKLFLEAEKLLVGTGVISPTYVYTDTAFVANYVKGYQVNPHSYTDYTKISIEK